MYEDNIAVQATDGRIDLMQQFVEVERELNELRDSMRFAEERIGKASMRRRELVAALHEAIDGPSDKAVTTEAAYR